MDVAQHTEPGPPPQPRLSLPILPRGPEVKPTLYCVTHSPGYLPDRCARLLPPHLQDRVVWEGPLFPWTPALHPAADLPGPRPVPAPFPGAAHSLHAPCKTPPCPLAGPPSLLQSLLPTVQCRTPGFLLPPPQTWDAAAASGPTRPPGDQALMLVGATAGQACPSHHWPQSRPGWSGGPPSTHPPPQTARWERCPAGVHCHPGAHALANGPA